ncbi:hypothetical protein NDU88_009675 [Pleurodeles waltl]|uniref:Uncharacterized protein n=1 Tax=Pleurodeles waltl TaxID=8319 RepID=A0AAV7PZQ1_PLEWA|nr:hypothetical protein NDU88_009675 [Pleurodeles waltl]
MAVSPDRSQCPGPAPGKPLLRCSSFVATAPICLGPHLLADLVGAGRPSGDATASPVRDRDLRPPLRLLRGTPGWGQQPPAPSRLQRGRAPPRPQRQDPGAQALSTAPSATGPKRTNKKKEEKMSLHGPQPPGAKSSKSPGENPLDDPGHHPHRSAT